MQLLLVGEDGVFLLIAGDDHLDALLQVGLGDALCGPSRTARRAASLTMLASSAPEAPEAMRAMVLKSTSAASLDLLGVDLEDSLPALQVRQLHGHPAVEATGAGQGRVQRLRAVGGRQDDDARVAPQSRPSRSAAGSGSAPARRCRRSCRCSASCRWRRSRR